MKKTDYEMLAERISELTLQQAIDLRRKLNFLKDQKADGDDHDDWLLKGIFKVLNDRGLGHTIPSNFRIKSSKSFGGFATQSERVRTFLDKAIPNMNVMEQTILGNLCAITLANLIESWDREVSLETMLFHIGRIPEALERSFPGYIQSRMLRLLVRRRQDQPAA
jgi:hypothetical protein